VATLEPTYTLIVPAPAVEIAGLTMRYAGRTVVDDLSLTAARAAITIVLGPNGAGKTTTIETAEGFRSAHGGTVRVLGHDPRTERALLAPRVGVMLQSGGVWPALRAADMLTHVSRLYAHPLPAQVLMERLGLTHVARTPYRRLSGGEQQKLALACALVGRPEVAFLDEPTTGLDPESRIGVWQFLAELRDSGVGIVMSTHLLDEAQALADHVIVIDQGRLAAAGSVAELTSTSPGLRFRSRAGMDVDDLTRSLPEGFAVTEAAPGSYRVDGPVTPQVVATVTSWCAGQGAMPEELSTGGGSLSEAYFAITSRAGQAAGPTDAAPTPDGQGQA
jgi:ABC-2 type transport system ATP-binding protein